MSQPYIEVRLFGKNDKTITVVNRTTIQAQRNNLSVRDDMTRRVLIGQMDAKVERLELREFARNPRAMILANRGKYVAACLTIVRACALAGRPGKLTPLTCTALNRPATCPARIICLE
ncbi:hypothetical protein FEV16_13040 [Methylocystis sp. B8]|nr:hypothetical protein FEV16_13040 [Methylocystis sp. B8]